MRPKIISLFSIISIMLLIVVYFTSIRKSEISFTERPNILFIMSDDHAESAISAYGS